MTPAPRNLPAEGATCDPAGCDLIRRMKAGAKSDIGAAILLNENCRGSPAHFSETCGSDAVERSHKEAPVDDDSRDDEPRPRGALLLILIYLVILTAFWLNTYLRIWRS